MAVLKERVVLGRQPPGRMMGAQKCYNFNGAVCRSRSGNHIFNAPAAVVLCCCETVYDPVKVKTKNENLFSSKLFMSFSFQLPYANWKKFSN